MKKAELRKIMKRAWAIKKENTDNIFSICLEMAWEEFKNKSKKRRGGSGMNVQNIKKGFYTDGERLFSNYWGKAVVWLPSNDEESDFSLKYGNEMARFHEDLEVWKVKPGMQFCNGEIIVLDKNTIDIRTIDPVNPVYDGKGYCIKHDGYREMREIIVA